MGKKDANGMRSVPVEQYRKQIGKQDYKKSRKEVKSMKDKAAMKESAMGIKDIVIVLLGFLLMLVAVYLILYMNINSSDSEKKKT